MVEFRGPFPEELYRGVEITRAAARGEAILGGTDYVGDALDDTVEKDAGIDLLGAAQQGDSAQTAALLGDGD